MTNRNPAWRPRFGLRTLLIATALVALITAWFSNSALRQRRAVAKLTKFGADLLYEDKTGVQSASWYPAWLRERLGIDYFAAVTEVGFGDFYLLSLGMQDPQKKVVLSERSRAMQRAGRIRTSVAPPAATIIDEEVMQQVRRLPHLRKLTIAARTTAQLKRSFGPRYSQFVHRELQIDPRSLQILRDHPTLEELDLSAMDADDEILESLHGFQNLKRLSLGILQGSVEGAKHLESLPNLEELSIRPNGLGMRLNSEVRYWQLSADFPRLANLRVLRLPGQILAGEDGRLFKEKLPSLRTVECDSMALDDEGLRWFVSLSLLQELNLVDSRITDEGAKHLAKLTGLHKLVLTNNHITDEGLRHLTRLSYLQTLYVPHLPITDAGLKHLSGATFMTNLVLSGTKITDAGLVHLSGMNNLTSLDLSFTSISDDSVEQLLRFKKLKHLRLLGTRVSQAGAERLRTAFPTARIDLPDEAETSP